MYTEEFAVGCVIPATAPGAVSLIAVAGVGPEYLILKRVRVRRLLLGVTTATTVGPSTLTFYRRVTFGSDTGRSIMGTLTVPTGTVAGKVLYKDIDEVELEVGDSITFGVTATTAGAGAGMPGFELTLDPEDPRNEPDQVLSA